MVSVAREFGAQLLVDRTGRCWDNAHAESFSAVLPKYETVLAA